MPSSAQREIVATVAQNLVRHRKSLQLSLDGLAARSGISKRMIIEIEQRRSNPSIATLCQLANALGVGVTELIVPEKQPRRLELHPVHKGRILWKTRSGSVARLIAATSVHGVWAEFWHWKLAPGQAFKGAAHPPGTKELLHVLTGKLRVETCGESLSASPSELITLAAEERHTYRNASEKTAQFFMIVLEYSNCQNDLSDDMQLVDSIASGRM